MAFLAVIALYIVSTMGYGVHRCTADGTASLILLFGESPCEYVHSHMDGHGNTYTHSHAPGEHHNCDGEHHHECTHNHGEDEQNRNGDVHISLAGAVTDKLLAGHGASFDSKGAQFPCCAPSG